jgi:hypothetical protein
MTAFKKLFLDDTYFQSLVTTGVNTNVIVTSSLPYVSVPTGTIDGKVDMSLQGVAMEEVAYADIDILLNIGKFAMNTNSTANFIVDKTLVDTEEKAKNYLKGILAYYEMKTLAYNETTPNLYTIQTSLPNGTIVGNTNATDLSDLVARIETLDANLNINTVGYYTHSIIHSLTVPV